MTEHRFRARPARPEARVRPGGPAVEGSAAFWTVTRDGWHLRPMVPADAGRVRDFLLAQYDVFNAVDNTPAGDAMFRDFVTVPALRARLGAGCILHVAERRQRLLGVCEIHRDGYLTLLYVDGDHQGRGLGRRLLQTTVERALAMVPDMNRLRVRATPYARGFYARLGFRETGAGLLQEDRGVRFFSFELPLPGRHDTPTGGAGADDPSRVPAISGT